MMSRHRPRRGLHVVKTANPDEEKGDSGINAKQIMMIGALTALTGTVVGAVSMELYRYFRPKIPIPLPPPYPMLPQAQPQVAQNPGYPWASPLPQYPGPVQPQYAPQPQYAIQQIGAFPPQVQPNPYPQLALAPSQVLPAIPTLPSTEPEPLSRGELARWQRGLEGWQRDLERRESSDRRDHHESTG